mmetsp:Transcript_1987/g.4523  ORF Transcript_1987/g.4523 Transcript_1987/m.4523 type:complete len:102 (-) Transcript_1987:299-604(-)
MNPVSSCIKLFYTFCDVRSRCFKDCGEDAHRHVSHCSRKIGNDTYFGRREDFDRVKLQAARERVVAYLTSLTTEIRDKLLEHSTWRGLNKDLGIDASIWAK